MKAVKYGITASVVSELLIFLLGSCILHKQFVALFKCLMNPSKCQSSYMGEKSLAQQVSSQG